MGGSSGATNRNIALTNETSAANNASTLGGMGSTANTQSQQLFNTLYGSPTSGSGSTASGGTGGSLSTLLNPANLNVTAPTGSYALNNTQENQNAEASANNNASAIKASAGQSGFGTGAPAGFTQTQLNANNNSLMNQEGTNYENNATAQQANNTNNFWNATNMANSDSNAKAGLATTDTSGAAAIQNNLYGTASKTTGGQGGNGQLFANQSSLSGAMQGAAQAASAGKAA